jgi:rod shape-determining protein MreC
MFHVKKIFRHKSIRILGAALSLSLIVGAALSLWGDRLPPVFDLLHTAAAPLRGGMTLLTENAAHIYGEAAEYDALRRENARLETRLAAAESALRAGNFALRENARLRELLSLRAVRQDLHWEAAEVLSRSADSWQAVLRLNRGSDSGLAPQNCVVDEKGALVGLVTGVGGNWADVQLITDAAFALGGEGADSEEQGILSGDFSLMQQGLLSCAYLPRDTDLAVGEAVLTFATEGVYPTRLLVGTVTELRPETAGFYTIATLRPAADLARIKHVYVITAFSEES